MNYLRRLKKGGNGYNYTGSTGTSANYIPKLTALSSTDMISSNKELIKSNLSVMLFKKKAAGWP